MLKNSFKTFFSFLLILIMVAVLQVPCRAKTVGIQIGNSNNYCAYSDDGTMTFTGTNSTINLPDYDSPDSVPWAQYASEVSKLDLDRIGKIGKYNFANFSSIDQIQDYSGKIRSIGERAFYNCKNVERIQIYSDSSFKIGEEAFAYCGNGNMKFINLVNVTEIKEKAFYKCDCENIFLNDKLEGISIQAFAGNEKLKEIVIPASCNYIFSGAFEGCVNLKSIIILNPACKISNANAIPVGTVISGKKGSLAAEYALINNRSFEDLYEGSWGECSWALDETTGVLTISGNGSMGESRATKLDYIDPALIKKVIIEDGVTTICNGAFDNFTEIESIVIPNSVKSIGDAAFRGCSNLTDITLPDGLESIGDNAFDGCSNIKSIFIPEGVTSIGVDAFVSCDKLTAISVPKSLTTNIRDTRFYSIYYKQARTYIDKKFFELYGYKDTDAETIANELSYTFFDRSSTFKVSFNTNGHGKSPEYQMIEKGKTVVKPDNPCEEGWIFVGWYINSSCTTPYDFATLINNDTILYAKWSDSEETITQKDTENNPANKPSSDQINNPINPVNKAIESDKTDTTSVVNKKLNPIKATVKTKNIKANKLSKKSQKLKTITVADAQGSVKFKLVKKGSTAKLFKKTKINSKGVITIKKVKLKNGNYKLNVSISATGNLEYEEKTVKVTIKVNII